MTYPITLTRQNAIIDIDTGEYWNPIPLLDIPVNIAKENNKYVFYCASTSKSNDDVIRRGDGSAENPFVDVNYALEVLCCHAQKMCADCAGLRLIVTGTINYFVCPEYNQAAGEFGYYDGNGVLEMDMREAVFTVRSNDIEVNSGIVALICNLIGIRVLGKDVKSIVSNSGDQTQDGFTWLGGAPGFIAGAKNCYFSFASFRQDVTSSATDATSDAAYLISGCRNCEFHISSMEVVSSNNVGEDDKIVLVDAISHNTSCDFHIPTVRYNLDGISGRVSGDVNIYYYNTKCTFNSCNAYLSMTVGPDSMGCGFIGNSQSTWNGENRGYCYSWLDHEWGDGGIIHDRCTLNRNCIEDPSSFFESSFSFSSAPSGSSSGSGSSGSSGSSSGSIEVYSFVRKSTFRLTAFTSRKKENSCRFEYYVTSIDFKDCTRPNDTRHSEYCGFIDEFEGYVDVWEDDDGNIIEDCIDEWYMDDCSDERFVAAVPDALREGNNIIEQWIDGESIYDVPEPTDIPISTLNWSGFKNYCRSGDLNSVSATLRNSGDTLEQHTVTSADYYSGWGENPCTDGDGYGRISLDTIVCRWIPAEGYTGPAPKKAKFADAEGNIFWCDFDKECCLVGNKYVDRDMLQLTTCSTEDEQCKYVIVKGTTSEYGASHGYTDDWPKPENDVETIFTFEGVSFE